MSFPSLADGVAMPAPAALAIHLDLVGGLAGDMFVAALADALPALADLVLKDLAAVQPEGSGLPVLQRGTSGGLRVLRFGLAPVVMQGDRDPAAFGATRGHGPAVHRHDDAGGRGAAAGRPDGPRRQHNLGARHEHGGTAYVALRRRLADAPLAAATRAHALALLALLAEAEAHVHGIAVDDVHFHELADWDSLLDIVAAGCIAAALEGAQWTASAPPLGGGTVRTAHGLLPVPAPATSHLLTGYPWRDDGMGGERVTPTGAAILRHLVPPAACAARHSAGRLTAVGCGAGTRELPGTANVVRALVFERSPADATDIVAILEFDVDDMSGEEIAVAADRLRAEPGVIDVSTGMRVGKKGRLVADFRLLARQHAADFVAQSCFSETSTLGLRVREERRRLLPRSEIAAAVDGGTLQVKVTERPGGERTAKAAHDDVAATRGLDARRRARAAAERRALQGDDE